MRILLITQNENMFLPSSIDLFLRRTPEWVNVIGIVVLPASPFGKKKSLLSQLISTLNIFGLQFVIRYGFSKLWNQTFGEDVNSVVVKHKLPLIHLQSSINSEDSLDKIKNLKPDMLISITGNQIFKKPLLDIPPLGTLNLHSALLPKYRGLMPSFWVLKNEEKETGVSVFFVDEGIDSGPIIVQKKINIENMTQWELIRATKFLGVESIIDALKIINSNNYSTIENDDNDSTYFSFPTRKDVIEFKKKGKKFF